MPSVIVKTIFFDLDKLAWTLTAGGNALLQPLTIGQNDTIDFNVQFIKSGAAQTLTSPSFTAGIKVLNGFSDSFVVQFGAPTGTPPTYTFTATISSTELSAALLTGAQFAIEFRDSTNGIVTLPALTLNIVASYTISGTTPTSANGTLVVAATKTVTFPQSLTFPSALGTNGFQLTTDGAGALTWAASGALTDGDKGDITVSNSGATFTIDNDVVGLAQLAHMPTARVVGRTTAGNGSPELLTISGTGSVAMTNTPTLVTPVLGAATATSINVSGDVTLATGAVVAGGGVFLDPGINGSGIASTSGSNLILVNGFPTSFEATMPLFTGTVAVTTHSATTTHAMFSAGAAGYTTRAIASADIATALTTPGAIGGTTASTGAFTTLTATGVTSITNATDASNTTTASLKTAGGLGVVKTAWLGADIRFATNGAGGAGNIFLGTTTSRAGNGATTTGAQNVCIGSYPGYILTTGQSNVLIGDQAGASLTTGSYNMCIGYTALSSAGIGADYNIAIGPASLLNVTSGDNNSGIGRNAGNTITTGGNNTFIGYDSDGVAGLNNQTAIGTNATCTAANQVMLGTSSDIVTLPGGLVTVPEALAPTLNAGITVSVSVTATGFALNGTNAATLANGTNGQIKVISCTAVTASGTATLTPTTSAADYNTIAFTAAGQTATLQYHTTGGWYILSLRGAVAA